MGISSSFPSEIGNGVEDGEYSCSAIGGGMPSSDSSLSETEMSSVAKNFLAVAIFGYTFNQMGICDGGIM